MEPHGYRYFDPVCPEMPILNAADQEICAELTTKLTSQSIGNTAFSAQKIASMIVGSQHLRRLAVKYSDDINSILNGHGAAVMARVFFLPAEGEKKASAEAAGPNANARVVVRLRLSDDGGTTWPLWLDVPVPGGCARSLAGPGGAIARAELTAERCAAPVVEPWPERAEGLTVSFGGGGAGGIAFAATSVRAFRERASVGSDADASSVGSAGSAER